MRSCQSRGFWMGFMGAIIECEVRYNGSLYPGYHHHCWQWLFMINRGSIVGPLLRVLRMRIVSTRPHVLTIQIRIHMNTRQSNRQPHVCCGPLKVVLGGWFPKSGIFRFSVLPISGEACPNCTWPSPTFRKSVRTLRTGLLQVQDVSGLQDPVF